MQRWCSSLATTFEPVLVVGWAHLCPWDSGGRATKKARHGLGGQSIQDASLSGWRPATCDLTASVASAPSGGSRDGSLHPFVIRLLAGKRDPTPISALLLHTGNPRQGVAAINPLLSSRGEQTPRSFQHHLQVRHSSEQEAA